MTVVSVKGVFDGHYRPQTLILTVIPGQYAKHDNQHWSIEDKHRPQEHDPGSGQHDTVFTSNDPGHRRKDRCPDQASDQRIKHFAVIVGPDAFALFLKDDGTGRLGIAFNEKGQQDRSLQCDDYPHEIDRQLPARTGTLDLSLGRSLCGFSRPHNPSSDWNFYIDARPPDGH
jgi:hypothetical protein